MISSDDATSISSVRGAEWAGNDFLEGVKSTIEKGNVVRQFFCEGLHYTDGQETERR